MAFDPTTEDAGIDVAALSRNLFESVIQSRVPRQRNSVNREDWFSAPDEVGHAPIAFHDCGGSFEKSRQFLSFGLLLLGGLDAGRGVTEFGNTFFGDPQNALPNEIVPLLERRQPILGEAWFARGDEPAQERQSRSNEGVAMVAAISQRFKLESPAFRARRFRASMRAVRMRR